MECDQFQKISNALDDPSSEVSKFRKSSHYQNVVFNVSQRLGMQKQLTSKDISAMWDVCRYQQSYHLNKPSDWCAVIDI